MFKKSLSLLVVILAGESIFLLPFLIPRMFRPLMMEAWSVTNTDIGLAFSAYGFTAMVSYVVGGPFADKYEPRTLMATSLVATAAGASVLYFSPTPLTLAVAYGFFGVSTILLMWSALIKVTHEIGGQKDRATAMGVLDGGRGLVSATLGTLLVMVVASQSGADGDIIDNVRSLNAIYLCISVFMLVVATIVWFSLRGVETEAARTHDWNLAKAKRVAKDLNLWLLSLIILSAYCGFKNVGNYAVYLKDVKGASTLEASRFVSVVFWLRPIAAFLMGYFADRLTLKVRGGRFITLVICFLLAAVSQLLLALDVLPSFTLVTSTILFTAGFAYALRAIYFSVFGDFKVDDSIVGTAVGIVSLVGYMPDFFFGALTGYWIDTYPGQEGFAYVFGFTGTALLVGALASFICYRRNRS